ncbi:hypothetical protein [Streptomyces sp. NPDC005407]|uniref:hypothetical protein n=1 Tax=Streptomyces sp. NPDC005407 TaxID=3155340 RepID=UPI0033B7D858
MIRPPRPVAAPGRPDFALHTLGWRAFQDLCAAVLREVWGQSVQTFADSNDGGRDGAFHGTWQPPADPFGVRDLPSGPFVRGPAVLRPPSEPLRLPDLRTIG